MSIKTPKQTFLAALLVASCSLAMTPASATVATASKKKPVVSKAQERESRPVRKAAARPAVARVAAAADDDVAGPKLASSAVAVIDQTTGDVLFEKNAHQVTPIASITKLMTAMVTLDAPLGLAETLTIGNADIDTLKGTNSRLNVGTQLTREEMLRLALMSSENRAASALSRHYPGGQVAFVAAMNQKAHDLGLTDTRFADPTGLTPANVSSARDLVKLVDAAHQYPLIREFSTADEHKVAIRGRPQTFRNTNALVKSDQWSIGLSKTGYISEAGKCLVMQAWLNNKPTIIVLLDSWGKVTRIADAQRIKHWVETLASRGIIVRS